MFNKDIVAMAKENSFFRQEIMTGEYSQVVLMCLTQGEDIGMEVHKEVDHILYFIEGEGEADINGEKVPVVSGSFVFIPAGATHNFINTGSVPIKLVSIYSPREHAPGTVHKTKAEALAAHHE